MNGQTPSEIMQRFHFHSTARKSGEKVATYLAELRGTAEHFRQFGASLDDMLRDRLVMGINDLLSQVCSNVQVEPQPLVKRCHTVLPTLMIMPDWIYLQEVFGILLMSKLLSM